MALLSRRGLGGKRSGLEEVRPRNKERADQAYEIIRAAILQAQANFGADAVTEALAKLGLQKFDR